MGGLGLAVGCLGGVVGDLCFVWLDGFLICIGGLIFLYVLWDKVLVCVWVSVL